MAHASTFSSGFWQVASVVDTRLWECDGARWRAVPGSGEDRSCDCCGRLHQVWVMVKHPREGASAVIGQTCARKLPLHRKERLGANHATTRRNGALFDEARARFGAASH